MKYIHPGSLCTSRGHVLDYAYLCLRSSMHQGLPRSAAIETTTTGGNFCVLGCAHIPSYFLRMCVYMSSLIQVRERRHHSRPARLAFQPDIFGTPVICLGDAYYEVLVSPCLRYLFYTEPSSSQSHRTDQSGHIQSTKLYSHGSAHTVLPVQSSTNRKLYCRSPTGRAQISLQCLPAPTHQLARSPHYPDHLEPHNPQRGGLPPGQHRQGPESRLQMFNYNQCPIGLWLWLSGTGSRLNQTRAAFTLPWCSGKARVIVSQRGST